jgi:AraC family ethanolamine operon transcriptional activator
MSEHHQQVVLVDRHFSDFDELTEAAKFWDLDFRQLDRGTFQGSIFQGLLGRMQIAEARFGRSLQQQGWTPPGLRTFVVLASEQTRFNWRRLHVTADDLLIFPRDGELYSISQPDFHIFTISLPEAILGETAATMGASNLSNLLRREIATSPCLVRRLRRKLRRTVTTWRRLNQDTIARLQTEIAQLIVQALIRSPDFDRSVRLRVQDRALSEVETFVARFEREPLTIRELCQQVDVSERTLRNAFLAHAGVSPKAYLTARRLNGVRQELRQAFSDGRQINDVAAAWGFWHMGQFAADYRRHFGELPSETLRRFSR